MINLLAATTNRDKIAEYREMIPPDKANLTTLADYTDYPEAVEDGLTFEENAAIKARVYFNHFGIPAFADDSGLEVAALNNEPGVNSARYAGPLVNYAANNRLLLEKMASVAESERQARFVCVICFTDGKQEWFFRGMTEGIILCELRGTGGFGYDPLFYLPELKKSYAELSMAEKNACSHRGKALKLFLSFLSTYQR